ncbi:MAG: family 78 glycoside hydrolase catalytic domain, partial [Anaerolineae bacterium]|nr:family 78 glycoside hydrolase catalytic domain [Anaerolineae bacterium]
MISNLICEYRTNPLGIDVHQPRLGWQMQTDRQGARQTAYRILAASSPDQLQTGRADLWDSDKVSSDQSVQVPYEGKTLRSRERVYWKVTVWDETNQASDSDIAWFEMGLLARSDWNAQWVGADLVGGPYSSVPAPYLRRRFTLPDSVESARLYITALGLFECSLNGRVIGDDVFLPGWTDYNKRIQYMVYDVTEVLQEGENVIGAVLGDGWAIGHIGLRQRQLYADCPRLIAQLEVRLTDGTTSQIITDSDWKFQYGPLLESDILMGESYDARLEMPGWDLPDFDDSDWRRVQIFADSDAALVATNGPTVKCMEILHPVAEPTASGAFFDQRCIYDLGQNMVGRVRLKASAPAGTTATLRFAEVLNPDGSLYVTNLRSARATDHYTFKGEGEEVWEPKFTFHGFRYVELSGIGDRASRESITGIVLYSDMTETGHFECSDETINQLQHNIVWSQKGNFLDVPTDCPQRDERLGWNGDIQLFARTAAFNMDIAGFMTKRAQDVADSQYDTGSIPPVAPQVTDWWPDGGPAWADAAIICLWTVYLCYSDTRILQKNYAVMSRFMDFLIETSPGYIRCAPGYEGWLGFGDWLSINAETPRDLIGTAFFAYDASLMAKIAAVLGKPEDAAHYQQLLSDIKAAFGKRYLVGAEAVATSGNKTDRSDVDSVVSEVFNTDLFIPTQTAYTLALHF